MSFKLKPVRSQHISDLISIQSKKLLLISNIIFKIHKKKKVDAIRVKKIFKLESDLPL